MGSAGIAKCLLRILKLNVIVMLIFGDVSFHAYKTKLRESGYKCFLNLCME
jgi:hypothetical protein